MTGYISMLTVLPAMTGYIIKWHLHDMTGYMLCDIIIMCLCCHIMKQAASQSPKKDLFFCPMIRVHFFIS